MNRNVIDRLPEPEIMTPEEVASYLKKSLSWVYKHWQILGGVKLGGSLFFPRKEDLMSVIFGKRQGVEVRLHPEGTRYTEAWFKTKKEAKEAEARKREELKNPPPVTVRRRPNRHGLLGTG